MQKRVVFLYCETVFLRIWKLRWETDDVASRQVNRVMLRARPGDVRTVGTPYKLAEWKRENRTKREKERSRQREEGR